jgi:hypothetical protein
MKTYQIISLKDAIDEILKNPEIKIFVLLPEKIDVLEFSEMSVYETATIEKAVFIIEREVE